jgi:pyridoxamine 5'-phosphate oxidase
MELWMEAPGRIHDRAVWRRELHPAADGSFSATPWSSTRLNP